AARRDFERSLASLQAMSSQRPEADPVRWVAELTQIYAQWVELPQKLFALHDDPLKNRAAQRDPANEVLYLFRTEMAPRAQQMNALLAKVTASQQSQLKSELA